MKTAFTVPIIHSFAKDALATHREGHSHGESPDEDDLNPGP
jgi:hypothetical protein